MPHLTTDDGIRLYYEEAGSGAPLVFAHEFAKRSAPQSKAQQQEDQQRRDRGPRLVCVERHRTQPSRLAARQENREEI